MISLAPTLGLAFLSFACSMFVILRVIIPILPPGPFSSRVSPSEFGLPNFKTLSPADKSHVWLAACDLIALALFIWQAVYESTGAHTDLGAQTSAGGAARLWLALTLRQTCLFVVAGLTLLHVRLGRPVSFGKKHWILAVPTAILVITSTGIAAVLAGARTPTLFIGLLSYSGALALFSTVAFSCLIGTLLFIRRNLSRLDAEAAPAWPPVRVSDEKTAPGEARFDGADIEELKDGASWITSTAGSRRESLVSAFSYSTHAGGHSRRASGTSSFRHAAGAPAASLPIKSSFWFSGARSRSLERERVPAAVPPVPPLPGSLAGPRSPTGAFLTDAGAADPFARSPSPAEAMVASAGTQQRERPLGSAGSWLTSESGSQTTMTAWSYPADTQTLPRSVTPYGSHDQLSLPSREVLTTTLLPSSAVSRPMTAAPTSPQVLGGYGFAPELAQAEKANISISSAGTDVNVSVYRAIGWLVTIWVPLAFSFPYMFTITTGATSAPQWASILLILSVTLSSPILAVQLLFNSPLPIPSDLFDSYSEPPSVVHRAPSPVSSADTMAHEYKRSASVTVVEGRRSGDVWLANGDAIDAHSKFGRVINMISSRPKLSVMPPAPMKLEDGDHVTRPIPIPAPLSTPPTPVSSESKEEARKRKESKASSFYSGTTEAVQHASRIMIAQRHYSTLATTLVVPPTPPQETGATPRSSIDSMGNPVRIMTGVALTKDETPRGHLRARSITSLNGGRPSSPSEQSRSRSPMSPPPASPLPPTPPTLKNMRAQAFHRRTSSCASASGVDFSFGAIENTCEIDALSAGVLPILMPGVDVGKVKITEFAPAPLADSGTLSKNKKRFSALRQSITSVDFSSPEGHSTPKKVKAPTRERTVSGHTRQHFSLPSLGLGKEGIHSLVNGISSAFQGTQISYSSVATEDGRRNTVVGGESKTMGHLHAVREEEESMRSAQAAPRPISAATFGHGHTAHGMDVPSGINTARSSMAALLEHIPPPSASSEVTLFDPEVDGPQAESTPHESRVARPVARSPAPPLPVPTRRSSIQYIRSDQASGRRQSSSRTATDSENEDPSKPQVRAVRPLRVKPSRLQAVQEASASPVEGYSALAASPNGGLRQLSLLRDRDQNTDTSLPSPGTAPLALGKKVKGQKAKGLKPLSLARSESNKVRAMLRATEVIPAVVVRPPSTSEHQFALNGYVI